MKKKAVLFSKIIILCVVACLYVLYLSKIVRATAINSDYSSLILEASDIIHGNIFLKGWNLTGISFITTDVPAFIVGVLIKGVDQSAYGIAVAIMIVLLNIAGLLICKKDGESKVPVILFLLLVLLPATFAPVALCAHTMSSAFSLFSIGIVDRWLKSKKISALQGVLFVALLCFACCGDSVALIVGVLPIICYCIFELVKKDAVDRLFIGKILGLTMLGTVLGSVLDKVYFLIGGANKNSFLSEKTFVGLADLGDKLQVYVQAVFMLFGAEFWNRKLISLFTANYAVNTLFLILGLILVIVCFVRFIKGVETDFVSGVLSFGIVVISLVFILTDISVDILSSRYMAYFTVAFPVLITRNLDGITGHLKYREMAVLNVLILMAMISFVFKVHIWSHTGEAVAQQELLAEYLEENGLESGYAEFWDASSTVVLSNGNVSVRSVIYDPGANSITRYNWFCKDEWFSEPANFVVTNEESILGMTKENVLSALGEPAETLEFYDWSILVYDKNIQIE
ncbi:hypothetical protein SAMN04487770_13124 [Butyrivibrio sp. ob235]|uniref:hypothetical protein n=1 Tax=Butyrivibrio sp. ob235 TaxID=1761780 RepID=UPI0008B0FF86|nr:hypothetical protein [Butyrivibrio sp. ob235]SEM26509.1 hypothetical protein SAMN04487770_13124 [Butyrivibrio sp. ob235]